MSKLICWTFFVVSLLSLNLINAQTCGDGDPNTHVSAKPPVAVPWGNARVQANLMSMATKLNAKKNILFCMADDGVEPVKDLNGSIFNGASINGPWNEAAPDPTYYSANMMAGVIAALGGDNYGVNGVIDTGARFFINDLFAADLAGDAPQKTLQAWLNCEQELIKLQKTNKAMKLIIFGTYYTLEDWGNKIKAEAERLVARGDTLILHLPSFEGEGKSWPASFGESIIKVGTLNEENTLEWGSDDQVDFSAPGVRLVSSARSDFPFARYGFGPQDPYIKVKGFSFPAYPRSRVLYGSGEGTVTGKPVACGSGVKKCPAGDGAICVVMRGAKNITSCQMIANMADSGCLAVVFQANSTYFEGCSDGGNAVPKEGEDCPLATIPAIGISNDKGKLLKKNPQAKVTVRGFPALLEYDDTLPPYAAATTVYHPMAYTAGSFGGVWGDFPGCSSQVVLEAFKKTALKLGDVKEYGAGIPQMKAAHDWLSQQVCSKWKFPHKNENPGFLGR